MTTLATMKERIASELARSNLTTQIADAINTAISEYQKQRFRFSDTNPSSPATFNTVADQWIYDSSSSPAINSMMAIDYVAAQVGGMLQELVYDTPQNIRIYNQLGTMHGQPMWYSYEGDKLLIGPVPDGVYAMTFNVFRNVPAPANDAEADNPWMTAGELLIRSRAKFEIATHVTRNAVMQEAMSPYPPPAGKSTGHATWYAWRSLKGEANRATGTGRIRPVQF